MYIFQPLLSPTHPLLCCSAPLLSVALTVW